MASETKPTFAYISVNDIERDQNQPRKDFGVSGQKNRLKESVRKLGVQQPIIVTRKESDRYLIIDGHRRYICALELGHPEVPCIIYPDLKEGQIELLRYELQNNRMSWKPLERAESLNHMKTKLRIESYRKLAELVHQSPALVGNYIELRNQHTAYLGLMHDYNLKETYQFEFVRLRGKIRKVKDLQPDDIIHIILQKIQQKEVVNCELRNTLNPHDGVQWRLVEGKTTNHCVSS